MKDSLYIAYRFESQTKIMMSSTPKRKNISIEDKYENIQKKQKGMSTKKITSYITNSSYNE